MKSIVSSVVIATLVALSSPVSAQEATREEFKEICKVLEGRWIGDITWAADWPGLGKKGEKVTTYWEGTMAEDGNALLGRFHGGNGSGTWLLVYDAGAKRIKGLWINSGGSVSHDIIYKENGKFVQIQSGSHADGTKTEGRCVLTIEENGNKSTWRGGGSIGGKKHDDYTDVWRRLSK